MANKIVRKPGRYGVEYCAHNPELWGYTLDDQGKRCSTGPVYSDAAERMARVQNRVLDGMSYKESWAVENAEEEAKIERGARKLARSLGLRRKGGKWTFR